MIPKVFTKPLSHIKRTACILFACVMFACFEVSATEQDDARLNIGFSLFKASLSANLDIEQKLNSDGQYKIVLLHNSNDTSILQKLKLSAQFETPTVNNHTLVSNVMGHQALLSVEEPNLVAGIFIAAPLSSSEVKLLLEFAEQHQILVFSPFERDVERGITAGIFVSSRIVPYINVDTMTRSSIEFKSYFLRVAKKYEQ